MTTSYPEFTQYYPATSGFLRHLLQPYHDALEHADSIESLTGWIPAILPESAEEINNTISDMEVNDAKNYILASLASVLGDPNDTSLTPWDISRNRNELSLRLFGEPSDTVPVTVVTHNGSYIHEMTQELANGILKAISTTPGFSFYVNDGELDHSIFVPKEHGKYSFSISGQQFFFDTIDFAQGAITGILWIEADPHTIITELSEINDDGTITPLEF